MNVKLKLSEKQQEFARANQDEVFFGGSAGGGKTYGQIGDAYLKALEYAGIKQLILRSTYPELEKSVIRESLNLYSNKIAKYNDSKKSWKFINNSIIDYGYCESEKDVYKYQSAEYDIIRIDEATHFTGFMYLYLKSRIRGANDYPKQMKCTGNPGNVGHSFIKERFIDNGTTEYKDNNGTRIFIPSRLDDNPVLRDNDPEYVKRLNSLPDKERRALRDGDWDAFEGQFFNEFNRDIHVIEPFEIPKDWYIYFTMDYGLDMLAGYWIAVDYNNNAYVFREVYEPNLIASDARNKIKELTNESVYIYLAPPDLWNRRQETGKSIADIFEEENIILNKSNNDRKQGWQQVKEWLKVYKDEQGIDTSKLKIFSTCKNLIRSIPQLQHDERNIGDVANQPHEITHGPDALRGFCVYWTQEPVKAEVKHRVWQLDDSEQIEEDIWY